ncbi:MAG: glycosyltransferase [Acidobacteria bacterium]|nr:glycosyltransferase [Acidobacteriota bacterium]
MRVLIVASWFPAAESPFSGVFIAEQARALARRHEVTVLAPENAPARSGRLRTTEEKDGYQLVRVMLPARNFVHHLDYTRAVVAEARAHRADVIHAHVTLPAGFAAVLAGQWMRRPVIITEHRGPFSALMQTPKDRFKVRYALERASAAVAVSSALAAQISACGIDRRIRVIPNLVDAERFALRQSTRREGEPYRLLFAGILRDENKNLPLLLRATAMLLGEGGDYRLTIVGDGEQRKACEILARDLGISEQCIFRGALDAANLAEEIAGCDLFVLPSRAETFGVVAAEALAVGRPVVAARCGGPEDFITDETGRLVPVDDENALAEAIADVCMRIDEYPPEALSNYARGRFGYDAVSERLTELYEEMTGARADRAAVVL